MRNKRKGIRGRVRGVRVFLGGLRGGSIPGIKVGAFGRVWRIEYIPDASRCGLIPACVVDRSRFVINSKVS